MKKSKRLNYPEMRQIVEHSHRRVTGEGLGTVRITMLIKHLGWLSHERLERVLAQFELSAPGYIAMVMINSLPDRVANPSELCEWAGETRANMTRITDELVAKGFLQRIPNLEDRRRVDLSLTEQGLEVIEKAMPEARRRNSEVFSVLTEEEQVVLETLLLKLSSSLESQR